MGTAAAIQERRVAAVERASPSDRAFLAMDARGGVPEQLGVVLTLADGGRLGLPRARELIAARAVAVPRLRQRLARTPFGCGGPVWIDDPGFDIRHHVRALACPPPGDERALLDTAVSLVATRLPRSAPLWAAVLVTGLAGGGSALVVVLHHALADGVGGLAVLASLADAIPAGPAAPGPAAPGPASAGRVPAHDGPGTAFPRPAPTPAALARDALVSRLRAVRHTRRSWRLLRESMGAGGGLHPPRAAPSSLNQRIGPRRRLAVVRADLATLRAAAHRHGATVNDAVLVAVAAALDRVLEASGERPGTLVVTVPVSGRRPGTDPALGNMVSPLLVPVPLTGDVGARLAQVASVVRAQKAAATGPPPIALLGWLFRPLAALGGYRWYMDHQHRFHTLVSHVRGPAGQLSFGGFPVISAIPVALGEGGNATVYFEVLSYAGELTLTATTDPDHFSGLGTLTAALRAELDLITRAPAGAGGRR